MRVERDAGKSAKAVSSVELGQALALIGRDLCSCTLTQARWKTIVAATGCKEHIG